MQYSFIVCNYLMPWESITMRQKLRSIKISISAQQHFYCFSQLSILKSRHFNIFKGNQNYHLNDKLPQGQTLFYDSYEVPSYSVSLFINRVKANRSENKSNIAHNRWQEQNNLLILIYVLHSPRGKNMSYSWKQQIK